VAQTAPLSSKVNLTPWHRLLLSPKVNPHPVAQTAPLFSWVNPHPVAQTALLSPWLPSLRGTDCLPLPVVNPHNVAQRALLMPKELSLMS